MRSKTRSQAPHFPQAEDDLVLVTSLKGKPYSAAFPQALTDDWLFHVVKILRDFERQEAGMETSEPNMAVPLALVIHAALELGSQHGRGESLDCNEEQLINLLRIYQYAAEREVVTRQLGLPDCDHEKMLRLALYQEIGQMHVEAGE